MLRFLKSVRTKPNKGVNAITVLICDDHALVREGLRALVETAGDIEIVGEVANGREAVRDAKRLLPDVVLMDVSMPHLNGMEAAHQIAEKVPSAKVLFLSAYTDDHYVRRAVEGCAGGYLMKGACARDLLPAIRATARGNTFFCPTVPKHLLRQWQDQAVKFGPNNGNAGRLSGRQAEVLRLMAD